MAYNGKVFAKGGICRTTVDSSTNDGLATDVVVLKNMINYLNKHKSNEF
jgi:hypothetical protein